MAKHLHDDRFDEFLKNSLDNYAESPPDSVWEGIEEAFPNNRIPLWRRFWWLGLAGLLLIGGLFYQHYYYQKKLDRMELKLQATKERAVASSETTTPSDKPSTSNEEIDQPAGDSQLSQATLAEKRKETLPSERGKHDVELASDKSLLPKDQVGLPSSQVGEKADPMVANTTVISTSENQNAGSANLEDAASDAPVGSITSIESLQLLLHSEKNSNADVHLNVPPLQLPGKDLWAGVSVGMYGVNRQFSQPSGGHHHGGGPNPHFEDQSSLSGQSISSGLMIEKQIANGLSLRTGLQYAETKFSSTHTPSFELGESMPGMHGYDHDFQYSLFTPSGTATLTLRVEQVDTSVQLPANENIGLKVGTNQKFRYASVPLGIGWRTQLGRFGLGLSADLIGNFLLESGMRVSGIEVQNPNFQVHHEGNTSIAEFEKTAPFYLEMATAASVSIKLRPELRLRVGPALRFQLTNSSADPQDGSKGFAAGFETALMYRF